MQKSTSFCGCRCNLAKKSSPSSVPVSTFQKDSSEINSHFYNKDDVIKSEIRWCLNLIYNRMSLRSCVDISSQFRSMFPDSSIAKQFSMSKTKASYVINHGISKHFYESLIDDVNSCDDFVICFNEALNKISQRAQMDFVIRYFDDNKNLVCTRLSWQSVFAICKGG